MDPSVCGEIVGGLFRRRPILPIRLRKPKVEFFFRVAAPHHVCRAKRLTAGR